MPISNQEFDLALLQLEELAALYSKDSAVVRMAQKFNLKRRALKKNWRLWCHRLFTKSTPKPTDRLKILVHVRGGIGDVCMTRMFIVHLREKFPTALIYFCYDHKSVVDMVFSDGYVDGFVPCKYDPREYDLVIAGCHAFHFDYVDRARLEKLAPHWMPEFEKTCALQKKLEIVTHNTPHLDGAWANISVAYGSARVANTGLTTGIPVGQNDRAPLKLSAEKLQETLQRLGLADLKYITIHDGTNTNTDLHGRAATRCWPKEYWQQFGRLFKHQFPSVQIVQLGSSNSIPFDFADVCLIGKTQIADLPYVLQGAQLHIDGESGMVHLANLTDTRSVVLFGPSPLEYLAYSRNSNLRAGTCKNCMCIYPDWMSRCPLFGTNQCLHAITPQMVMSAVEKVLHV